MQPHVQDTQIDRPKVMWRRAKAVASLINIHASVGFHRAVLTACVHISLRILANVITDSLIQW